MNDHLTITTFGPNRVGTGRDCRALPPEVLERLRSHNVEPGTVDRSGRVVEEQRHTIELRADDPEADPFVYGYGTVWDEGYDMYGGPERYGWVEHIARGSADKSLRERDDVRLLINHQGLALARTGAGTLSLEIDDIGLRYEATLDGTSPLVVGLASAMRRGDMSDSSFAMQVLRQEWNDDYTERWITELRLFDVSVVTYPANPLAPAGMRDGGPSAEERQGMSARAALVELLELEGRR